MKITNYGVTLSRLTEDKIELVRNWRNDPKIVQYMEFKEYITPEMQLNWFNKINNENNFYFIIEYNNEKIGLVNVKDIDYEKKEGEAGIFIYNEDCLNSTISFQVSLCFYDFCFDYLKLDKMIAHILHDNKRAVKFNKMIGFNVLPDQELINNQLYILTAHNYFNKRIEISPIISLY
jgi:RimJ/RimL family protein N-acetyltransferase